MPLIRRMLHPVQGQSIVTALKQLCQNILRLRISEVCRFIRISKALLGTVFTNTFISIDQSQTHHSFRHLSFIRSFRVQSADFFLQVVVVQFFKNSRELDHARIIPLLLNTIEQALSSPELLFILDINCQIRLIHVYLRPK